MLGRQSNPGSAVRRRPQVRIKVGNLIRLMDFRPAQAVTPIPEVSGQDTKV